MLYIDVGSYIVVLPVLKDPLKELKFLKIKDRRVISGIRKEAYESALKHSFE